MEKRESFEVHVLRDGRWTIDATTASQPEAEGLARKALARQGISGVRVIREVARGESSREKVVFEQTREVRDSGKLFVNDIDEAAPCETVEELYAARGRQTINRLFRSYLDKQGVTATEVMHDARELRRIVDADTLIASGVGKVATLQAKGREDVTTNARRDLLYGFLDTITARARAAAERKLPIIRTEGFENAVDEVVAGEAPECDFLLRVMVTRELVQQRSFFGKLAQTVDWAEPADDARSRALLDTFMSDILANAETLQDLLGPQPNLCAALGTLVDLAQGQLDSESAADRPADSPEALAGRLNALLGLNALPDSQAILVDRIRRQLEGKNPLSRGEPEEEAEAFQSLIGKLMPEDELFGGSAIAEALTHRQSRLLNKGGVAGLKEATGRMLPTLSDPARKAAYLLALSESRLAASIGDEINMQLEGLFVQPESVRQIVKDNRPPNKKMQTITTVFHKITASCLDGALKSRIVGRLDELLAEYIVGDRILERLDDPSRPLHVRAFMLLSLCTPEMLPEGKASKLAREIVVKHLRRPNFESELVAAVPAAEKERVLRDFHVQLYRCGFMQ